MLTTLDIATSGLVAQRTNLDVIAGNIAMRDVTRNEHGDPVPYRRKVALFSAGDPSRGPNGAGVHVSAIAEDPAPPRLRWEPGHPDAVKTGPQQGYVRTPNVDYHTEMVNAITAVRAYEANTAVIEMAKHMASTSLRLLG